MDYMYYRDYLLDDRSNYELSSNEQHLLDACIWIVDNRATIRQAEANCSVARSTLHKWIHTNLKSISFELYQCVCHVLKSNQRNRR